MDPMIRAYVSFVVQLVQLLEYGRPLADRLRIATAFYLEVWVQMHCEAAFRKTKEARLLTLGFYALAKLIRNTLREEYDAHPFEFPADGIRVLYQVQNMSYPGMPYGYEPAE